MLLFGLIWTACFVLQETQAWGYKNGILHNSIWLEQAAGVYHRESRKGRYQLTYAEAKAVCKFEGGNLATYDQLEAARKIGLHVCAAGWFDRGRVGYPIVKPGSNCGFGKIGIIDYGYRLNKSERWDVYCYNPHAKECGGVLTDQQRIIQSPGYPEEYEDEQICYWHIRVRYGQQIRLRFLEFDVEDDAGCLADYLEIYDSYDDISGFAGRLCGDELPEDMLSTGNVMTLKFLSDSSVTAGGFQLEYLAIDIPDSTTPQPFILVTDSTTSSSPPEPSMAVADSTSTPDTTDPFNPTIEPTSASDTTDLFNPTIDPTSTSETTDVFDPTIDPTSTSDTTDLFDPTIDPTSTSDTSDPFNPTIDPTSSSNTYDPFDPTIDPTSTSDTSDPFNPTIDPTSSSNTSDPFDPTIDPTSTSDTSDPFNPTIDPTSSSKTSDPFDPTIDPTSTSDTTDPFNPTNDPTSSSNTTDPFDPTIDPTSSSNPSEPFSSLTDQ